jgi:phage shock protein PspC (stress-responsive transcriptional regulator)
MPTQQSQQWFYAQNGQKFGPIDAAGIKQLAAAGQLQLTDLVWREGMAEWSAASRVKGLFPESVNTTTPPPLPTAAVSNAAAAGPETNLDERYNSLYCSSDEKWIFGLCAGIAHKFKLPKAAVRFAALWGPILFYFVALFLPKLPTKDVPSLR